MGTVTASVTFDQIVMKGAQFAISAGATLTITDGSGIDCFMDDDKTAITVEGFIPIESGAWFEAGGGNGLTNGLRTVADGGLLTVTGAIRPFLI